MNLGDATTGETLTVATGATAAGVDHLVFTAGGATAVEAINNVSAGVKAGQYTVKWDASNQTVQLFDAAGTTNIGAGHKVDLDPKTAPANQTFTLGDPEQGQTIDITVATAALDKVNNTQDIITISSSSGKVVNDGTSGVNATLASVVSSSNFLDNGSYTVKVSAGNIQLFDQNNRAIGAAQTWVKDKDFTLGDATTQRTVVVHTANTAAIGTDATIQITNNGQSAETAQFTGHAKYESARAYAGLDVSSANAAAMALDKIDKAIGQVSYQRSQLGAIQNRLDHTINNLQVVSENLTASESRIRDVDMAMEMTQFTKHQILMQSGTAMLAQANQKNQAVLSLLR
jgi:flagellin